jgi:selenocysteine lyase/cysteine desulfurase
VAALINAARPDEVVPLPGTAAGISTAAISLSLRPGDNELVLDGDCPPVSYPKLYRASKAMGLPSRD